MKTLFKSYLMNVLIILALMLIALGMSSAQAAAAIVTDIALQSRTQSAAFTTCAEVTGIAIPAECDALVALYNSTNGLNWANNGGWLITDTPCTWYESVAEFEISGPENEYWCFFSREDCGFRNYFSSFGENLLILAKKRRF